MVAGFAGAVITARCLYSCNPRPSRSFQVGLPWDHGDSGVEPGWFPLPRDGGAKGKQRATDRLMRSRHPGGFGEGRRGGEEEGDGSRMAMSLPFCGGQHTDEAGIICAFRVLCALSRQLAGMISEIVSSVA
jgi:hypothetical protein